MSDCLACDLTAGAAPLPGGLIFETKGWRVEHCVGTLGVGRLIAAPFPYDGNEQSLPDRGGDAVVKEAVEGTGPPTAVPCWKHE